VAMPASGNSPRRGHRGDETASRVAWLVRMIMRL
jgi:hypothetical protein